MDPLLSLVWLVICVVVIAGMAYLFTKYVAGRGRMGFGGVTGGTEQFRVLARLALGREQAAALVRAGERYFLLGLTASQITVLSELTREEAETLCGPLDRPAPPGFRESLRTVLQQKKPR